MVLKRVLDTTSPKQRRQDASGARRALKALADRSLDLDLATNEGYDEFLKGIKISGRS